MRVTIGLPVYNSERTLEDTLRSIFAQTHRDWNLLLVDDGSTDRSLEIANSVRDPRVSVTSDGANRGLAYRLNQITSMATGDYVARMDADDLMHPERLERQVSFLEANSLINVLGTAAYTIDGAGIPMGIRCHLPLDFRPSSVLDRGLFIHSSVTARRTWLLTNPYSYEFKFRGEDHELWSRVCTRGGLANLSTPLLFYREALPINLRTYVDTCRSARRIIYRFGPTAVGRLRTGALLGNTVLRECIYRMCISPKAQSWLIRRRSTPLSLEQRKEAAAVIASIRNTSVPGLPLCPGH